MNFEDLTYYDYYLNRKLSNVKNVGWLSNSPFKKGDVSLGFLKKLRTVVDSQKFRVNQIRGVHACNLCGERTFDSPFIGSCELWVPDGAQGLIYAAPSMIVHYVEVHGYKPPDEFIEAVMQTDSVREYEGQLAYDKAISESP
jgi:hypothetical protein